MAEGGDVESFDHGSDDCKSLKCSPCNEDGLTQNASKHCAECDEYLCTPCANYHSRLRATKSHKLIDVDGDMLHSTKQELKKMSEKCVYHPERNIELYCKNHDMVYCALCIATEHRTCENVLTLTEDEVSASLVSWVEPFVKETKDILESLSETITETVDNIHAIESQKASILEDIEKNANDLINQVGDMKQRAITELSEVSSKLKAEKNLNKEQMSSVVNQLGEVNKKLQSYSSMGNVSKFICIKLAQNSINSAKRLQQRIKATEKQSLNFRPKDLLSVLCSESLGRIFIDPNRPEKVQYVKEFDVNTETDRWHCFLIDICLLSDGTVILADNDNETLKRLTKNYKVCEQFKLAAGPLSIAQVSEDKIAVKLDNKKIEFVSITQKMSRIMTCNIANSNNNFGMVYENGKLWVNEGKHLCTYDKSGSLISSIDMNETIGKKQTFHMTFNLRKDTILLVNRLNGIFCVGINGENFRTMTDARLRDTRGVCISQCGTVFVTGRSSNNIVMFREDGECLGELELPQNLILEKPSAILYDDVNHQLLVTSAAKAKIYVIGFDIDM